MYSDNLKKLLFERLAPEIKLSLIENRLNEITSEIESLKAEENEMRELLQSLKKTPVNQIQA